jgi:hypothetical protein
MTAGSDGDCLVSADAAGMLRTWSLRSRKVLHQFVGCERHQVWVVGTVHGTNCSSHLFVLACICVSVLWNSPIWGGWILVCWFAVHVKTRDYAFIQGHFTFAATSRVCMLHCLGKIWYIYANMEHPLVMYIYRQPGLSYQLMFTIAAVHHEHACWGGAHSFGKRGWIHASMEHGWQGVGGAISTAQRFVQVLATASLCWTLVCLSPSGVLRPLLEPHNSPSTVPTHVTMSTWEREREREREKEMVHIHIHTYMHRPRDSHARDWESRDIGGRRCWDACRQRVRALHGVLQGEAAVVLHYGDRDVYVR